jgi:hypothetical protein
MLALATVELDVLELPPPSPNKPKKNPPPEPEEELDAEPMSSLLRTSKEFCRRAW